MHIWPMDKPRRLRVLPLAARALTLVAFVAAVPLLLAQGPAQPPAGRAPAQPTKAPAKGRPAAQAPQIKSPENLDLLTADGVELKATYYPGWSKDGKQKDVVPVILLHMWKGSRADMHRLALGLQKQGHAVVAPDLRGHGKSTRTRRPGRAAELDAARLRPADFQNMVRFDLETIKSFLLQENNKEQLNIEKLCVVGAEMGAAVAVNWAALDWSWPVLPTLKQGRDVKAIVLISPELSFKGLKTVDALNHTAVKELMSVMIVAGGEDTKYQRDARKMFNMLEKLHPLPPENERQEKQDLFFFELPTKQQGTNLLNEPSLNLDQFIHTFINWRLVQKSFPWTDRTSPLAD